MADADDMALFDRWCGGDNAAGNALFKRYSESIYTFFCNKVDVDVADLMQETFLACIRKRDDFRKQSSFRTFLFAIARYKLLEHWRKLAGARRHLDFDEVTVASLSTSAPSRIEANQDRARLLAALRSLPLDHQILLELHYWEGFDGDQLAEVFDVEPTTTRTRMHRARKQLEEVLSTGAPLVAAGTDLETWARSVRPATAASE